VHLLLNGRVVLHSKDRLPLLRHPCGATLASSLVLDTASLHLVVNDSCSRLLGLGLVDVLHEDTLVLEDITLRLLVKRVVEMLVNLSSFSVFPQQPTQNPLPPHPLDFGRHPGLRGTLSLTGAGVTTFALSSKEIASSCTRMNCGGLDDDATVLDELLYVRAGVGIPDFRLFIGVKPDFALADTCNRCGKPLLRAKVDHGRLES